MNTICNRYLIDFWLGAQATKNSFDETEGRGDNGSRLLAEILFIYLLGRVHSESDKIFLQTAENLWGLHAFGPAGLRDVLSP